MKSPFLMVVLILIAVGPTAQGAWPHGGPGENAYCLACHSVHKASASHLLRGGTVMCASCHAFQDPKGLWPGLEAFEASAHNGLCTDCHNPHGARDGQGQIPHLAVERGERLCFGCHLEVAEEFAAAKELEAATGVPSRHHVGRPGTQVSCIDCHNPHLVEKMVTGYEARVTNPNNPLQKVPFRGNMTVNKYCLVCHNGSRNQAPDILAEIKGEGEVTEFFALTTGDPLHQVHLNRTHRQNCLLCHNPHASRGALGVNRGRLLYDLKVEYFDQGYPGYNSCETQCHGERCGSCHQAPPFDHD
ncbi:MAG: hypothetical protein H0Z38_00620 [Firmicutes bacterium]|nr:hypothetical protein [Bacillota bacterium]